MRRQRTRLTLAQYVERRNGVPLGSRGSLANMLERSLGAGSFAEFWRHWNPIWGYYLAGYVHSPLRRVMPAALAVVLTFAVSGALHDAVIMLIRGSVTLIFVPWFVILGMAVVVGSWADLEFGGLRWSVRAAGNVTYLLGGLGISLLFKQVAGIP